MPRQNSIIQSQIGGHTKFAGNAPAANTVKALLTENLIQRRRVTNQAERWLSSRRLTYTESGQGALGQQASKPSWHVDVQRTQGIHGHSS